MRPSRVSATRVAAAKATATRATPTPSAGQRTLYGAVAEACPESAHAIEPAIVVLGFAVEVLRNLGERKNQELLTSDAFDHNVGYLLGFESTCGQEVGTEHPSFRREHVSLHALRTQTGHPDSLVAGGDGNPLEK